MIINLVALIQPMMINAQVTATDRRYIRTGPLQSFIASYGRERAYEAASYYEGLVYPAEYSKQDNAVINRVVMGCRNYTDEVGKTKSSFAFDFYQPGVGITIFPVVLNQTSKFETPNVYVDGSNVKAPYIADVDSVDPTQIADRVVTSVFNTVMGVTVTRKVYYFTQQYHDNYFINVYTFKNTGNRDYDDDIESQDPITEFRTTYWSRYSCGWDGADVMDGQQEWGKYSWSTQRGENYADHYQEKITEANPIVDWIRCGFQWMGQSVKNTTYDNIGAPWRAKGGRLAGPNHPGIGILHVDKSPADHTDDPHQPNLLGWHLGDSYYGGVTDLTDTVNMAKAYLLTSGIPYENNSTLGGTNRFDEDNNAAGGVSPVTAHGNEAGMNIWRCYGPWDLAFGDSIVIVEVEGVHGLSRTLCEEIGARWLKAYNDPNDNGPFILPNGQTTTDENEYKDHWVWTGKDSIMLTISRAKRNFDSGFAIPQPPAPPAMFNVESGGDRISLSWSPSVSESEAGFAGYEIYRATGKPDTSGYVKIHTALPGVTKYDDLSPVRGFSYYYYIVAVNDGSNNTSNELNPTGPLYSNRFYTRTTDGAYLRRKAGKSLEDIRIVPNPYNIKARNIQYTGEKDKMMFLNIPGKCTIRIFTVNGDLIETIHHIDGSGDQAWESATSSNQIIVSGIYIVHFTVDEDQKDPDTGEILYRKGDTQIRRAIIVR